MPSRITVSIAETDADKIGATIAREVEEDFDRAMDLVVPLEQPSSALQARENLTFHNSEDGKRMFVRPEAVAMVEEL